MRLAETNVSVHSSHHTSPGQRSGVFYAIAPKTLIPIVNPLMNSFVS
uniref:Uncharacterized protein SEM0018 n=1 Tax=Synechococcus elongatus (strain ATCC 33912 / PCC 7942 / FACHB-805) TaxID=1140 RepID=Q8GJM1_SYNE7|nr:unknown protein [Synechococcus elongatus PCC 7942 = FACHB-805]